MATSEIWLSIRETAALLGYADPRTLRRDIRMYPTKYVTKMEEGATATEYKVLLSSLPAEARARAGHVADFVPVVDPSADLAPYHQAPEHARRQADKYKSLLTLSEGLKGRKLDAFVARWNAMYPDQRTSYRSIMTARQKNATQGLPALLSRHGEHLAGKTSIPEQCWEFFREVYLQENAPPLKTCWEMTLGYALEHVPGTTRETFPSYKAFERLLRKRVPQQAIYQAREGHSKWYRKYASFVKRDYSETLPGDLWVSDHVQLDVMVTLPNGRTCRPWVTVWMDVKSAKILGWCIHAEAPNSDHIFQAFYNAAVKFGIPKEIYIDNGKDYRARALSGGRISHTVQVDETRALSLVSVLDIVTHFALPYNAQSKTIERRFLELKNRFARIMVGFTGGNVVEKPEALANQIRLGKLMTYAQAEQLAETYITQVYNLRRSQGTVLQGEAPDAYYAAHAPVPRMLTADALMLFCTRICLGSGGMGIKVAREGVHDSALGLTYWAEWMQALKGTRVYLRRDPKALETAWVFNAETHAYIGKAPLEGSAHMIARDGVQKAALQELIAVKRREEKMVKSYQVAMSTPPEDRMRYLAAGTQALSGAVPLAAAPAGAPVEITSMDHVLAEDKRQESTGTADISRARPPAPKPKAKLYRYAFERLEAEEAQRRQAGA